MVNRLTNKRGLQKHMKLHEDANFETQTCPICKKVVQNKRLVASHIRNAHAERRHQCILCDKAFKTTTALKVILLEGFQ